MRTKKEFIWFARSWVKNIPTICWPIQKAFTNILMLNSQIGKILYIELDLQQWHQWAKTNGQLHCPSTLSATTCICEMSLPIFSAANNKIVKYFPMLMRTRWRRKYHKAKSAYIWIQIGNFTNTSKPWNTQLKDLSNLFFKLY